MCARHRYVSNGGHKCFEAKCGTLLGVLLCPECRGRVSLGPKADPQAWLSHLPTRGAHQKPALIRLSALLELDSFSFFCLSWFSVNCAKMDLENKDIS